LASLNRSHSIRHLHSSGMRTPPVLAESVTDNVDPSTSIRPLFHMESDTAPPRIHTRTRRCTKTFLHAGTRRVLLRILHPVALSLLVLLSLLLLDLGHVHAQ
jgi:hypothetical protein